MKMHVLEVIKNICAIHTECSWCPFLKQGCPALAPAEWEIDKIKNVLIKEGYYVKDE